MTPPLSETQETPFQKVRRIMRKEEIPTDFDPGEAAPWTDFEFEAFASQEPLPPNQGFQLNADEQIQE